MTKNTKHESSKLTRIPGAIAKENYFCTPIFFADVDGAENLNADLVAEILELKDQSPEGIVRSNVDQAGAWHSTTDLHRRKAFFPLAEEIFSSLDVVFEDQGYDPDYEAAIDMMWANVSPRHAFNRHHSHPGVLWSGVYYVKAPANCGRILFSDPRVQARVIEPFLADKQRDRESWAEVYYEPLEGRLLLFPAWLSHEVEPNIAEGNELDCMRISISFNVFQRRAGRPSDPNQGPVVRADIEL